MVGGLGYKEPGENLRGDGTVLYLHCGGGYVAAGICQNLGKCLLRRVYCTVCKLHINF